ncbi:MAG: hypothetical protein KAQ64_04485 [Candidatus Pacebacteria bacterium]|nr:hypothetical protein [Candidatus Paceibacterota bacterium]
MINKFKNKLKKIQDEPEETKIKIIWIFVAFCMIVVVIGLYISLNSKKSTRYNYEKSIFSSFPNFKSELDNINKISKNYNAITNEAAIKNEEREIEEAVKNYIEENNYLKDANLSDLKLKNIEKWKNSWYVEYEQYHKDILVYKSSVSFIISDEEEKIAHSDSNFDTNIEINNIEPRITEDEAFNLIADALKNESLDLKSSEIVVYRDTDSNPVKYYLAWKINVFSLQPICDYIYLIDAQNGEVISFYDNLLDSTYLAPLQ